MLVIAGLGETWSGGATVSPRSHPSATVPALCTAPHPVRHSPGVSLYFPQNLELRVARLVFAPFTLNYSVVEVSKIKDF